MTGNPDFKLLAEAVRDDIIAFRRELHENPELPGQEIRTSRRIAEELEKLGIPYVVDEKRNVIGKLVGAHPGKKIAIRADFDALPVQEETGLPYASRTPGVSHACGHDGHAASLLGIAKILMGLRQELCGTVYLCFQMGEEICEGALEILRYLKEEGGVDMVIAAHLMPGFPPGVFICPAGPMMAGTVQWELTVKGVGGHGSSPWVAVDPIKPLCEIVLRITALNANRVTPFDAFVVSPCLLQSGTADNIIPEVAKVSGTMRFYKPEHRDQIPAMMESIAKSIAASYGAEAELKIGKSCMPVVNDAGAVELAKKLGAQLGYPIYPMAPATGSDNYGELLNEFKGFYIFSGITKPGSPMILNHNPKFDIDEDAMIADAVFMSAFAYQFNNGQL